MLSAISLMFTFKLICSKFQAVKEAEAATAEGRQRAAAAKERREAAASRQREQLKSAFLRRQLVALKAAKAAPPKT